jgi:hypothetical protein
MKIGVIAIQGNVAEHVNALERTLAERNDRGEIIPIRQSGLVSDCDAIVLPGGESTTLARLMWKERADTWHLRGSRAPCKAWRLPDNKNKSAIARHNGYRSQKKRVWTSARIIRDVN